LSRARVFIVSALVVAIAGCGWVEGWFGNGAGVRTRTITFQADGYINHGLLLPIDIIYVADASQLGRLATVGPKSWFSSPLRDKWLARQSLGILSGQKITVRLVPALLARSRFVVIFASFMGVEDPRVQEVVLDNQAREHEVILVHPHSLEPLNPLLKALP